MARAMEPSRGEAMNEWDDDDWFEDSVDYWTAEEHAHAMMRICRDNEARRELLWLRAKEKDDEDAARSLERADPGIVARLMPVVEDYLARGHRMDTWRERSEGYGELWDERFAYHAVRLSCGSDRAN
jgi:hypothetical protein